MIAGAGATGEPVEAGCVPAGTVGSAPEVRSMDGATVLVPGTVALVGVEGGDGFVESAGVALAGTTGDPPVTWPEGPVPVAVAPLAEVFAPDAAPPPDAPV
jgi:hypothetical protein